MSRRYAIAAGALAAAAIAVFAGITARPRGAAPPVPAGLPIASASEALPPPPPPPPPPPREACEVTLARIISRLGTDDAALSNVDRDKLFQDAREFGRPEDGGADVDTECRRKAFTALVARKTCGRAEAAVAGGLAVASVVDPADLKSLVEKASPGCAAVFAESAGFAAKIDEKLARALLARARKDPDEVVRRSAWLAYGSTAEIASRTGREDVRTEIETAVMAELSKSTGKARLLSVQTAGNAGCRPCLATLLTLSAAHDTELRRNAVAAMRFHDDLPATRRMCAAVEHDADSTVRDLSAWALGLRTTNPVVRVPCLYRGALGDTTERVRLSATQSLGALSDDLQPAYAALVQLTDPAAPSTVRELAMRILETDKSRDEKVVDEATVADFLKAAHEDSLLEDASARGAPR